jgi:putative ABC transport system permease protein
VGDIATLQSPYGNAKYGFTVTGIYDYPSTLAVFMNIDKCNRLFNFGDDYYNGYFSNEELTDLNEKDIASTITVDDLTKVSRQLTRSVGGMMSIYTVFGTVMFMLLIYLLSKLVIEKNSTSISMIKIIGYSNLEVARLYILATTLIIVLSMLVAIPICNALMDAVFKNYLATSMSGWLPYYVEPITFVKMFLLGVISYSVVAVAQLVKVKKIPMSDTLKNVE